MKVALKDRQKGRRIQNTNKPL